MPGHNKPSDGDEILLWMQAVQNGLRNHLPKGDMWKGLFDGAFMAIIDYKHYGDKPPSDPKKAEAYKLAELHHANILKNGWKGFCEFEKSTFLILSSISKDKPLRAELWYLAAEYFSKVRDLARRQGYDVKAVPDVSYLKDPMPVTVALQDVRSESLSMADTLRLMEATEASMVDGIVHQLMDVEGADEFLKHVPAAASPPTSQTHWKVSAKAPGASYTDRFNPGSDGDKGRPPGSGMGPHWRN